MTSSDSEKDRSKQQTLKEPKLVQLAKVLMQVVYSNAFQSKTCDWSWGNSESQVFLG